MLLDELLDAADQRDCELRLRRRYGVFSAELGPLRGVGGNLNSALRVLQLELAADDRERDALRARVIAGRFGPLAVVDALPRRRRGFRLVRGGGLRDV